MDKILILLGGLALAVVTGIGGFVLGSESRQGTIDRQEKQLATCTDVANHLKEVASNAFDVVDAGDDLTKLEAASDHQKQLSEEARSQFGTDYIPSIIRKCSGG